MVELIVKLGPKGQLLIPKILREQYNLFPNQSVVIGETAEGVVIKKDRRNPLKILEEIADKASEKRKGAKAVIDPHAIYEQYEKRTKRAGI